MMASNLNAIVENQEQRRQSLVFAHNRHLERAKSRWELGGQALEWWCAGLIVSAHLGDQYVFAASAVGAAQHQGLNTPRADTLEGVLSTRSENRYVINSKRLAAALGSMGTELVLRTDNSTNYGYFALDPDHLEETDAVILIKRIAPGSTQMLAADSGIDARRGDWWRRRPPPG